jgi:site-specific DNA-adenine methylase
MTLTAYLSDTNEELIKAYNVVKANDGELIEVLTERSKVVFL